MAKKQSKLRKVPYTPKLVSVAGKFMLLRKNTAKFQALNRVIKHEDSRLKQLRREIRPKLVSAFIGAFAEQLPPHEEHPAGSVILTANSIKFQPEEFRDYVQRHVEDEDVLNVLWNTRFAMESFGLDTLTCKVRAYTADDVLKFEVDAIERLGRDLWVQRNLVPEQVRAKLA